MIAAPNPDISYLSLRLSLIPGFSPVAAGVDDKSRFNGFTYGVEAAEAAESSFRRESPG
jgi:hypothetical protein